MTTYYVDPSSSSNGTGLSQNSPMNTVVTIRTNFGDSILLKTGTKLREMLQFCLNNGGQTIGYYGTGSRPIISGGVILDNAKATDLTGVYGCYAWAFDFSGTVTSPTALPSANLKLTAAGLTAAAQDKVTYIPQEARNSTSLTNRLGNVTQDGIPMVWIPWNQNLQTTISTAMINGGVGGGDPSTGTLKFDTAGYYTHDYVNKTLYVIPRGGTLVGSEFEASVLYSGIATSFISAQYAHGLTIDGIEVSNCSTLGLHLAYRDQIICRNGVTRQIGGAWETGSQAHVGNGIQLTIGTCDSEITDWESYDIFDSAYSPQIFDDQGNALARQLWARLKSTRAGLAHFEASLNPFKTAGNAYFGTQVIEGIFLENFDFDNSLTALSQKPIMAPGRGQSGTVLINNGGAGAYINNLRVARGTMRSNGAGAAFASHRTAGVNTYKDIDCQGFAKRFVTAYASIMQSDVYCRVTTDNGAPDQQFAGNTLVSSPNLCG